MIQTDPGLSAILELLKNNPRGLSVSEIADAVHANRNTAARNMDKLLISGQVEMRSFGKAKVYFISRRVPVSAMLNLSSEMVLLVDADLKVIQVNAPLLSFLSAEAEDVIGKAVFESACRIFCSDILTEQIRRALQGEVIKSEIRLLKNMQDVYLEERISPMVLSDGRPGVSVILDDVTSEVNAKTALEKSEEMYRQLVETVSDVIWSVNDSQEIQYISPQCLEVLGYEAEELLGKKFSDFMPTGAGKRFCWELDSALSQDNGFTLLEYPFICRDGRKIYCEFSATPIVVKGEADVFLGYNGALHDVTDQRNAELGAKRWKYFLDAVIDNIPALITVTDLKSRRIVYVNEPAEKLIGYPKEQLTVLSCDEFAGEVKAKTLGSVYARVAAEKKTSPVFADEMIFSGKICHVSARVVYFSLSVELEYMATILSDIVFVPQENDADNESEKKDA